VNALLQVVDPANIGGFFAQLQVDVHTPAFAATLMRASEPPHWWSGFDIRCHLVASPKSECQIQNSTRT